MNPSIPHALLLRRRHPLVLRSLAREAPSKPENKQFQFDVLPLDGRYPRGWVLMDLPLGRHNADCSLELKLNVGEGFDNGSGIRLVPNRRGKIHGLIALPPNIVGMRLLATREVSFTAFILIEVGLIERVWRMVRRVVPLLWQRSPDMLRYYGLSVSRLLFDLRGAYRAAGHLRANELAPSYEDWRGLCDQLSNEDRRLITQHISQLPNRPRFILLVSGKDNGAALEHTLRSIHEQLYQHCLVVVLEPDHPSSRSTDAVARYQALGLECRRMTPTSVSVAGLLAELCPLDYLAMLQPGDRLSEHALYWMANAVTSTPKAKFLYSDEDCLTEKGDRVDPQFKPDWSPESLRSTNYIGGLVVCDVETVIKAGGLTEADCLGDQHDLLLRITDVLTSGQIVHVPAVLYHRAQNSSCTDKRGTAAVEQHLVRNGIQGVVEETRPGLYRVRYRLPANPPLVSIIIPTRDGLDLIRRCINSLCNLSTYRHYEILIVDNQSTDEGTLAYLRELRAHPQVRVLSYDHPFNYSAINNLAVRQANGEVLCLLNNDIEVISPDWMEEMVGHLLQKQVGVVGAKLYYPDGRVQHAGDAVGIGGSADHFHMYLERDAPGYCHRAVLAQDLSAVTAACLMTWRTLYQELGGLDEEHLPVAFNDVDYCLRVREAGHRVVWTPHAELYHYESVSRGRDDSWKKKRLAKREVSYLRLRWRHVLPRDPFYNPNLNYERPDFRLGITLRVRKPWLPQ